VVARQLGKVCLVGCGEMHVDETQRIIRFGETVLHEGDTITLDGNEGAIYQGAVRTVQDVPEEILARLSRLSAAV
jgi:pyruvate,orthophosphate dikinase